MSIRQLHENDPVSIVVSDKDGKSQGVLIAKQNRWCWVNWEDFGLPVTENVEDLWVCETNTWTYVHDRHSPSISCQAGLAYS